MGGAAKGQAGEAGGREAGELIPGLQGGEDEGGEEEEEDGAEGDDMIAYAKE